MVLATTAFLLATLGAGTGVESQDPEHLGWVVSPGALLGLRSGGAFDAAGELSLIASKGRFSIGAVFGSAIHTHSFELQPTASIGGDVHGVILGLNPGVVLDRTADSPRIGSRSVPRCTRRLAQRSFINTRQRTARRLATRATATFAASRPRYHRYMTEGWS